MPLLPKKDIKINCLQTKKYSIIFQKKTYFTTIWWSQINVMVKKVTTIAVNHFNPETKAIVWIVLEIMKIYQMFRIL